MEDKEITMEAMKVIKECITLQNPDSKDKENRVWRNFVIKTYCLCLATIIFIVLLFVVSDMYKTYKIYDYQGYPDQSGTTIENTQIGGDNNAEATATNKTAKTTETTETTKEEKEIVR